MKVYEGRKPVIRCVEHVRRQYVEVTTAAAHGVFWRSRMGCGTRINDDRYFVTLPKNITVEDVLID